MVKLKPLLWIAMFLLLVVAMMAGFTALWLRGGEKSLNWAKPFIASRFNNNSSIEIAVGDVTIDWRDLTTLGLLKVKNVSIAGRNGAVFATLPEMYVGLDVLGFLPHRHALNVILIRKPKLFLTRDNDKVLRLGLEGSDTAVAVESLMGGDSGKGGWNGKLPFRHLILEHASVTISDAVDGTKLVSPDATLKLSRTFGHYHGLLHLPFTDGDEQGDIEIRMQTPQWGRYVLDARLIHVPMDDACVVARCPAGMALAGKLDAALHMRFNERMQPQDGSLDVSSNKLTLTAPQWFAAPLEFKPLKITAQGSDGMKRITASTLDFALPDTHITATAAAEHRSDGWYVDGKGGLDKLDIETLYKYWPLGQAAGSRQWVIDSLSDGYGVDSTIALHLTPQDFTSPTISDKALQARVNARNLTIHYLPGFPELKGVNGTVNFTGTTITADVDAGSLLSGTTLSKTHIAFPDLNKDGTPMEVSLGLSGPAADVATMLALEHFHFDDGLMLDPATLQGNVEGTIKLKFDAFSGEAAGADAQPAGQIDFSHILYDIDTKLTNIAQPNFAGNLNLSNATGTLKANNDGMHFDGAISSNGASLQVTVDQKSGEDVKLALDGTMTRDQLTGLGMGDSSHFGDGALGVKAGLTVKKDTMLLDHAALDMGDMAVSIPEISWAKKRGVAGTISLAPDGANVALTTDLPGITLTGAQLTFSPSLALQNFTIKRLQTVKDDFGLSYNHDDSGYNISLTGNTLDASQSYQGTGDDSENALLKNFPAVQMKVDLGAFILVPNAPLAKVKGTLNCSAERCESANITAQAGRGDVLGTIKRVGGQRQFSLTAGDAGDFLRAFDITDRMYGGRLSLVGAYDDKLVPPALPAHLHIDAFTLKNSEILGRILSIGSLSGLANALTGKGIDFDKLDSAIYSRAGLITINDGKASGNAIGITVGGTVDTTQSRLNLKGTLAPAYALNSIIGSIPILGDIAGGKEGLIAFNYSVKGPYSKPDVSVNPFSGLTPGFLRAIWGSTQPKNPVKEHEATGQPAPPKQSYPK